MISAGYVPALIFCTARLSVRSKPLYMVCRNNKTVIIPSLQEYEPAFHSPNSPFSPYCGFLYPINMVLIVCANKLFVYNLCLND